ncbi:MAG: NAD-dependent epimerase/dehydratase family protein [Gemmatimonadales bacterium]
MRLFLTGATGVVGRRAVPLLIAQGHRVSGVARTPEKRARLERLGADPVSVDLFNADAVRQAVAGHDAVINLATHIPGSPRLFLPGAWTENDRIRREASTNLASAAGAGGAERFIQESFAPVYSDRGDAWIDESTPIQPAPYNRTVMDAERAAESFSDGRIGIVLRFAGFYGPDAWHVQDMIRYVRKGWAPIPGSPGGFFSSVSHDDAATAVVAALRIGPGVYNVVDDEPVRRREFFDSLAGVLGVAPPRIPPAWMAGLAGSVGQTLARSLRISNRKLRIESGWAPKYPSVREGWRAVVEELGPQTPQAGSL